MALEVTIKKWGNSLGIIIPKEIVQKRDLKNGTKVLFEIVNPAQFDKIWGSIKFKRPTKEIMKDIKEGWK